MINQQIAEYKNALEAYKDTPAFTTLTIQLNRVLEKKDIDIKQRKRRKYLRDTNYYQLEQSYKWQLNLKEGRNGSVTSAPEREVRMFTPIKEQRQRSPVRYYENEQERQSRNYMEETPTQQQYNGPRTPRPWWQNKNNQSKPWNKSPRKPFWKHNGGKKPRKHSNNKYDHCRNRGYDQYKDQYQNDYTNSSNYGHHRQYHQGRSGEPNSDNYYQNYQDRQEARTYHQYQQNYEGNREQHEQYQYAPRYSPIQTHNRYEPLRDYRDTNPPTPFLDRRINITPPRQTRPADPRSPNAKGDAEEDTRSKRKREH